MYAIVRQRNVYQGTLGINGHAHVMTEGDQSGTASNDPLLYDTAVEAQAAIDEIDNGVYVTMHGEAGRPDYWIVPVDATEEIEARAADQGRYDWPDDTVDWDCADKIGNVCGQCDQCIEWTAGQDDNYLASKRVKD